MTRVSPRVDADRRPRDYGVTVPGLRSLPRTDVAIAAVLVVYAIVEGVAVSAPAGQVVVAATGCAIAASRRRYPALAISALLVAAFSPGLLFDNYGESVLPLPAMVLAGYTAGRELASRRDALLGAGTIAAVAVLGFLASAAENHPGEDLVAVVVIVGGATGAGRLLRRRDEEQHRLRELSSQLAEQRDAHARAAVIEERAQISRELHDIVAHSVSLIAIQAAAAKELLGRDEARARDSLDAIQAASRGALTEMRRLMSVLRSAGDEADPDALAPQPGLAVLDDLMDQARAAGLELEFREEGARPPLSAGLDLSVYRIVQEALTNVRKHAGPVATEVVVRYRREELELEVANAAGTPATPPREGPGHGLAGMAERARIYGGVLEAGREDGRYVVRAQLPLTEGAA